MKMHPLFRTGYFRDLLAGQAISAFGDWMATIALMALVLDLSGSPTAVGGVLALRLMPSMLAGPLATSAALKWDRRKTMLAMDLIRAGLVVVIPFVHAIWWVYVFAFLTELANLIFLPARDAAIPDLVDHKQLPTANGLILVSSYGNIPIGAAAFAGITSLPAFFGPIHNHPYVVVFVLDALTYLVSFVMIRRIELPEESSITDGGEGDDEEEPGFRAFLDAFRYPLLRAVLPGLTSVMLGIGALFSLGIVYVREVLNASTFGFGLMIAIFGVGASGAVAWLQTREEGATITVVRGGVTAMGVMLSIMALVSSLLWSYGVAVLFGAAAATALVGSLTYLQEELEGRRRVIGFAAFHMLFRFGLSLAAIFAGVAVEHIHAVTWPLIGEVAPSSLILFLSGLLVIIGGVTIRPGTVHHATTETTT